MSENDDDTYDVNDNEDDVDDDEDIDDGEYMHDGNYEDVDDDIDTDDDHSDDDDDCNIQRAIRYYPLHTAIEYAQHDGRNDIAIKLIELCPEVAQYPNSYGRYPLHVAVGNYSLDDETVMKLIEIFPMAVNKSTTFGNSLHLACVYDKSQRVITKIIELNPLAIQEKNGIRGFYPIHYAIERGQLPIEIIKLLLDGDPLGMHRRTEAHGCDHATSFHLACRTDRTDLVQYFMQRSDLQINVRGSHGTTPLSFACQRHRREIIDLLLRHPDIDVNARDHLNDTPLHKVLGYYNPDEDPKIRLHIIQKLLDHSSILINEKNTYNKTPLDLIKSHLHKLEELDDKTIIMKRKIQCSKEIITLLEEFPVKQKWKSYCYHLQNIMDL